MLFFMPREHKAQQTIPNSIRSEWKRAFRMYHATLEALAFYLRTSEVRDQAF